MHLLAFLKINRSSFMKTTYLKWFVIDGGNSHTYHYLIKGIVFLWTQ